ncbi:MAG: carboxy-S-adenosyl-L-methionine synthase CmoA [Halieaceae bacterium]|jgi:tRNA (cmo5U34)-methyltransferase|nr:carboxy-S-adenosyl-L-methionine synthase CmoA [Halieaceae bacterium]
MTGTDDIYASPLGDLPAFRFDETVVKVFPDMIQRSVPGYSTIIAMTGLLAQRHATPGSRLYDLGCSLGASTLAMRQQVQAEGCRIIGVDNSPAMIARCETLIAEGADTLPVELVCDDIENVPVKNASVVVLNFTLQFIPLQRRTALVNRICEGLQPGGILVLSEKVLFEDPHLNELNIELHHQFKRANGYSELEIAQKRQALENVLLPETLATHKQRLGAAGFRSADVWFQCFNFASLVALK